ncbi:unnamed protein product [Bursaphelenchus xylophilus]|uniref:Signal recognition particle subunit SRP72 n=1 Tax=Bursaphelenchus xylophilus TaxID=6326 RepID=A0A1I7RWR2_BURXY|nr:unnamed protein product [Bursaphelenchus xylophilus]CAG9128597.1 unnamed protein product [Bursaphelenchus xylophilus]
MAETIRQYCIQLAEAEEEGDFDKILEITDTLLESDLEQAKSLPLLQCKLTALLQTGQLDEALKFINRHGEEKLGDTVAARAYIYYRQNKNDEAFKTLEDADPEDLAALELKGQLYYRVEKYPEAYEIYKKLCREVGDDYDDLRRANMLAVLAQAQWSGQKKTEPSTSGADTYEQLYNLACHQAACEKFDDARKTLDKAIKQCREQMTEEGSTAGEIDDEVAVFLVQKAYILHATGNVAEAIDLYKQVQDLKPSDSNVRKVLAANLAPFKNKYLLRRALKKEGIDKVEHQEIVTGKLRKRKRKVKLPKNYDPNATPDPERWIPKTERSTFKSKKVHKKFKDRDVGRGTQGASNVNTANIDYTTGGPKESPKPSPSPAQPGPRKQQKGKKKKR